MADLQLEEATRDDLLEWRDRLLEARHARAVNCHVRSVAAALNRAVDLGYLGNPVVWKLRALANDIDETGETAVFLDAAWRRHVSARAVRAAIANHNRDASAKRRISADASAYSFHHARISELLHIYGVDPLTVAAQNGTSIAMIEKAYLRFNSFGNAGEARSADRVGRMPAVDDHLISHHG